MGVAFTPIQRKAVMDKERRKVIKGGAILGGAIATGAIFSPNIMASSIGEKTKTVVFASGEPLTGNWDPTSHTILGQINFEGFVFGRLTRTRMKPENPYKIEFEMATGSKLIDKYTLEYTLRKGITFHDGKEFKAEDVKATYEYSSQEGKSAWYPGPVEVEIVDDYTVRLKTEKYGYPASAYILLASFLPIMSAKDVKNGKALKERPNGTGPFKFVEQKGDTTILESFDKYYEGKPLINAVHFSYMGDANTRLLALLGGQADIIERLEPEQYKTLLQKKGVKGHKTVSTENKYLHFRCNKKPFDDPRIRMAAVNSIDRSVIMEVMGDAGHASSSYVSPVKLGGIDIPGYPKYDPANAQKLLAEAGFAHGKGLPELEYITSTGFYPKTKEYGEVITAMLQEQGFKVKLTVLETAAWLERIYQPKTGEPAGHLVDVGWATGSPEPDLVLRPMWHSSKALITGYKNKDVDKLLDAEQAEGDVAKRLKIITEELMPMLAKQTPSLSLFTSVLIHGLNENLNGVEFYPNGPLDLVRAKYN